MGEQPPPLLHIASATPNAHLAQAWYGVMDMPASYTWDAGKRFVETRIAENKCLLFSDPAPASIGGVFLGGAS